MIQSNNNRIQLLQGDCIKLMDNIEDKSIDMILCDLPYGVLNKSNSNAKWDSVIPFKKLWGGMRELLKITVQLFYLLRECLQLILWNQIGNFGDII